MKTFQLLKVAILALFLGNGFVSCTDNEQIVEIQKGQSPDLFDMYKVSQNFILSRSTVALDSITIYLHEDIAVTKNAAGGDSTKLQLIKTFETERHISDSELAEYLERNPEEIETLTESVCSEEFVMRFKDVPNLYTPFLEKQFIESVSNSADLSNLEKEMLLLLAASENNYNPATRSLSSCIKRYAKLTEISVKAVAISVVDVQAGVEYATRELKNMGSEYDC